MKLKPGVQTSEFAMTVAAQLIAVALYCCNQIDAHWTAGAIAGLSAIYAIVRGWTKSNAA